MTAPDTTGGELREAIYRELVLTTALYGNAAANITDQILALPALRDLLAERDTLAALRVRVAAVMNRCNEIRAHAAAAGSPEAACAYDDAAEWIRRALGTPTTGGGE